MTVAADGRPERRPADRDLLWILLRIADRWVRRLARSRVLAYVLVIGLPLGIRAWLLPALPVPSPIVHDEFSYLLGGQTLAAGRLTNPPHPMWEHFEAIHTLHQPTYTTKYPPGQPAALALGWKLGHPWFGVLASVAVMCGCLLWMLRAWLPHGVALLVGLTIAAKFGIAHYWVNSYWGGAVAAAGGALLLGALPRLARAPDARVAAIAATGLAVLANTRPFEGFAFGTIVLATLVLWRWQAGRPLAELTRPRVIGGALLVAVPAAAFMAYYNFRVTGHPLQLPFTLHYETYALTPWFYLAPDRFPERVFRHEAIRDLWQWDQAMYYLARQRPLRVWEAFQATVLPALLPAAAVVPAAFGVMLSFGTRYRYLPPIVALFCAALLMEKMTYAHYAAPGLGALVLVLGVGLRRIRPLHVHGRPVGLLLVTLLVGVMWFDAYNGVVTAVQQQAAAAIPADTFNGFPILRQDVIARLQRTGGRHVVIVRYGPRHSFHRDWVFNDADIDASRIVWARDMGEPANRELLEYFDDRKAWILDADMNPPRLSPHPGGAQAE